MTDAVPSAEDASISVNGQPMRLADGTTVAGLLQRLKLAPAQVAVEVNQRVAPRADHERLVLHAGDEVEIVTFVGGGQEGPRRA